MLRSSNGGFHTISFGFDSALSPSYERKLGSEGYEQVIKLLKRIVRRLRLFFCGLFTRPTAPRRAPRASLIPSNPESAPKVGVRIAKYHHKIKRLPHFHRNPHWLAIFIARLTILSYQLILGAGFQFPLEWLSVKEWELAYDGLIRLFPKQSHFSAL